MSISKDDLIEALRGLSPEQLSGILAEGHGRSPLRPRQLHDLRLAPTATDPRPLFIPSAEGDRTLPIGAGTPYPKLLWHTETGQEITVHSLEAHQAKGPLWVSVPPNAQPLDPVERAREMFASLSPEDQAFVLETQRQAKIAAVSKAFAGLSESQAGDAMSGREPAKRGRPRKDSDS